jgi:ribosomal-protein-alanine N-acetyltransferase
VRVEATTRPENVGSTQVLLRNAFTQFGRSTRSFQLAGAWYDLLYFEKRADA